MGGKLNVYNLGEKGVNRTKTPLHHEDGELLSAQNAEFYAEGGVGGLRKRPGLQALNSVALAGTVTGIVSVPLPAPGRRTIMAQTNGFPWFRVSLDGGTTWADATGTSSVPLSSTFLYSANPIPRAGQTIDNFFYVAKDGVDGVVLSYDGETEYEIARFVNIGASGSLRMLCVYLGLLAVANLDTVWLIDPVTGARQQIGDQTIITAPMEVFCGVSYLGKLFIGIASGLGGADWAKVYTARLGDTSWVLDHTAAAQHKLYTSMAVFQGKLYAATAAIGGATAAIVEERTNAAAWTTSRTGIGVVSNNKFDGLTVMDGNLYATYDNVTTARLEKFTGSVWSLEKDFTVAAPPMDYISGIAAAGRLLYVNGWHAAGPADNYKWRRSAAGVWSLVDTDAGAGASQGVIGIR